MSAARFDTRHRPRELRRRVVLPARLRHGTSWSDACILNVSSRGMMIQSLKPSALGSVVQLYRGAYVIEAKVVWKEGLRSGLQVEEALPVEEILSWSMACGREHTAADCRLLERRTSVRAAELNRWRGRALEFAGTAMIALVLCVGALTMLQEAFARPMAVVERALAR